MSGQGKLATVKVSPDGLDIKLSPTSQKIPISGHSGKPSQPAPGPTPATAHATGPAYTFGDYSLLPASGQPAMAHSTGPAYTIGDYTIGDYSSQPASGHVVQPVSAGGYVQPVTTHTGGYAEPVKPAGGYVSPTKPTAYVKPEPGPLVVGSSASTGYVKPTTKPSAYWEQASVGGDVQPVTIDATLDLQPGLAGGLVEPISAWTPSPAGTGYVEPGPIVAGSLEYLQPASGGGLVQPMETSVSTGYVKPTTKPTAYWEPGLAGGVVQPISALTPSPVSTGYVEPGPVVAGSLEYLQPMKTSVPTGYVKPTTKPTAYWEHTSVGGNVQPMTIDATLDSKPGLAGGLLQPISALNASPVSTGYVEPEPVVAGSLQYLQPASVGGLVQPMKTSLATGYVKPMTKPTAYWEQTSVGGHAQPVTSDATLDLEPGWSAGGLVSAHDTLLEESSVGGHVQPWTGGHLQHAPVVGHLQPMTANTAGLASIGYVEPGATPMAYVEPLRSSAEAPLRPVAKGAMKEVAKPTPLRSNRTPLVAGLHRA